jgi:hypothetical protein
MVRAMLVSLSKQHIVGSTIAGLHVSLACDLRGLVLVHVLLWCAGEMAVAISSNPQLAAIMSSAVYSIWFIFAGV